jgi:hypothetical protein
VAADVEASAAATHDADLAVRNPSSQLRHPHKIMNRLRSLA